MSEQTECDLPAERFFCPKGGSTCYHMEPYKHIEWKEPDAEHHTLQDSVNAQCPEQVKTQRKEVHQWLQRTGGGGSRETPLTL